MVDNMANDFDPDDPIGMFQRKSSLPGSLPPEK